MLVTNEDGNRCLCCCLWVGCTWRTWDTCAELGLRGENEGKGGKEKEGKGKRCVEKREKCRTASAWFQWLENSVLGRDKQPLLPDPIT